MHTEIVCNSNITNPDKNRLISIVSQTINMHYVWNPSCLLAKYTRNYKCTTLQFMQKYVNTGFSGNKQSVNAGSAAGND